MKKNKPNFRRLAKHIVPKKTLKQIKKIEDKTDRHNLYQHSLKSHLEITLYELEKLAQQIQDKNHQFHLSVKLGLLSNKAKYFLITHDKKDYKKIVKEIKSLKRELGCSD